MFGRICSSQRVTNIERNVFPVISNQSLASICINYFLNTWAWSSKIFSSLIKKANLTHSKTIMSCTPKMHIQWSKNKHSAPKHVQNFFLSMWADPFCALVSKSLGFWSFWGNSVHDLGQKVSFLSTVYMDSFFEIHSTPKESIHFVTSPVLKRNYLLRSKADWSPVCYPLSTQQMFLVELSVLVCEVQNGSLDFEWMEQDSITDYFFDLIWIFRNSSGMMFIYKWDS